MYVPDDQTWGYHFRGDRRHGAVGPLELVFVDVERSEDLDAEEGDAVPGSLNYFTRGWNAGFHIGEERDVLDFDRYTPLTKGLRNPNVAVAPRLAGYSELHGLLASLCPDDVLARHRLSRSPANFLLSPFFVARERGESVDAFRRRMEGRAAACCDAFRDHAWDRLVRQGRRRRRQGDYDTDSSLRVLFDDSKFWMNAAYRAAMRRAESRLAPLPPAPFAMFVDRGYVHDLVGHLVDVPVLAPGECFEMRQPEGRLLLRRCRGGRVGPSDTLPSIEEMSEPIHVVDPHFVDTGARSAPSLTAGPVWDPADPAVREELFRELLGPTEVASLEPVVGLLRRDVLPEDLPERGWSYVKEDLNRVLYRKPRRGQSRFRVEFRDTVDDHPVIDEAALLVDGEEVLRSVMVLLDPREKKVVVLLRSGRSRNEIAHAVGFKDHTGLSRMISRIEARFRKSLGLAPRRGRGASDAQ